MTNIFPRDLFFISAVPSLTIIDYVLPQCIVCHIFFRSSVIGLPCSLLMDWMLTLDDITAVTLSAGICECILFRWQLAFMRSATGSRKDNSSHMKARRKIDLYIFVEPQSKLEEDMRSEILFCSQCEKCSFLISLDNRHLLLFSLCSYFELHLCIWWTPMVRFYIHLLFCSILQNFQFKIFFNNFRNVPSSDFWFCLK